MKKFLHVKKAEHKTIISIFLALAIVFGVFFFTACTEPTPEGSASAVKEAEKEYNGVIANIKAAKSLTVECDVPNQPGLAQLEDNKLKLVEGEVTTYYQTEQNENFEYALHADGWHKFVSQDNKIDSYKTTNFKMFDRIEWWSVNKDKVLSGTIRLGLTALSKVPITATYDLTENTVTYSAMDYTVKVYGVNATSVTLPVTVDEAL